MIEHYQIFLLSRFIRAIRILIKVLGIRFDLFRFKPFKQNYLLGSANDVV